MSFCNLQKATCVVCPEINGLTWCVLLTQLNALADTRDLMKIINRNIHSHNNFFKDYFYNLRCHAIESLFVICMHLFFSKIVKISGNNLNLL